MQENNTKKYVKTVDVLYSTIDQINITTKKTCFYNKIVFQPFFFLSKLRLFWYMKYLKRTMFKVTLKPHSTCSFLKIIEEPIKFLREQCLERKRVTRGTVPHPRCSVHLFFTLRRNGISSVYSLTLLCLFTPVIFILF